MIFDTNELSLQNYLFLISYFNNQQVKERNYTQSVKGIISIIKERLIEL